MDGDFLVKSLTEDEHNRWLSDHNKIHMDDKDIIPRIFSNSKHDLDISLYNGSVTIIYDEDYQIQFNKYDDDWWVVFDYVNIIDHEVGYTDEDGYLIVYTADGSELWKSGDKFGGSESYFNYDTVASVNISK